jgi:hypothetical protein
MLSKSQTEDAQDGHQITRDGHYSYVGLGHIIPNRVLTCRLSSLTSCIGSCSIKYGRIWLQSSHLLAMIGIVFLYI